jgi:hypothetical protein
MQLPPVVIRAYLRRGAVIWLTMRLCVSVVLAFGREDPLRLAPATVFLLVIGSGGLMLADIRRRHERMLIGNLGIQPVTVSCLAFVPAVIGELGLRLAMVVVA